MKKVMVLASVASMIQQFNMSNIKILKEIGYEVEVACNFENGSTCSFEKIIELKNTLTNIGVNYHHISFARNAFNLKENIKAYKQVKKLIAENKYSLVHCHAPIGGVITRIAFRNTDTKIIYTAHGFHFYKGAPLLNWLIYYPLEKFLSKYTDVLITINKEDYELAKLKMKAKKVYYVPGIGVNTDKFAHTVFDRDKKRTLLGIPQDATFLISVGELSVRKNHELLLKALSNIDNKNIYYCIVGQGSLQKYLEELSERIGIKDNVKFLGFRNDINELLKVADIFCFPSLQEGLPVALMEAMASGLPCIVSKIRGNVDLIENGINGFLFDLNDVNEFVCALNTISTDKELCDRMKVANLDKIKHYDISVVEKEMKKLYSEVL